MAGIRGLRRSRVGTGDILTGRGIAYSFRGQTVVAQIAEVEVNRKTGHVWAKRLVCAHDCGLVVNPESLRRTVECGTLHGAEPRASRRSPVRHREGDERGLGLASDAPPRRRSGAHRYRAGERRSESGPSRPAALRRGEAALKPMLAAIANAIYDATGVRIRSGSIPRDRVLAALKAARV